MSSGLDLAFWQRLLPDADHRFQMHLRPGDATRFWQLTPASGEILAERTRWLAEPPGRYLCVQEEAAEAISEVAEAVGHAGATAATLATVIEPDWLVLAGDESRFFPVIAGAVLFPSGWALEEKIGLPLHAVHGPVPGLQSALGSQIARFLAKLAPQASWERDNWGLSADPGLNHHPALLFPRLDAQATLSSTWLRLEQQILQRLPRSGAVLFGIRVTNHRLDQLMSTHPTLAPRLMRALETMDRATAEYKGLATARGTLAEQMRQFE